LYREEEGRYLFAFFFFPSSSKPRRSWKGILEVQVRPSYFPLLFPLFSGPMVTECDLFSGTRSVGDFGGGVFFFPLLSVSGEESPEFLFFFLPRAQPVKKAGRFFFLPPLTSLIENPFPRSPFSPPFSAGAATCRGTPVLFFFFSFSYFTVWAGRGENLPRSLPLFLTWHAEAKLGRSSLRPSFSYPG